jgi:uncharacterized membrane protein (UPF0136 family)
MQLQQTSDRAAIALSMLCIAHCLLLPVLVLALPALTFLSALDNEIVHGALALAAIPVSAFALTSGFRKHQTHSVVWTTVSGIVFLMGAFVLHDIVGDTGEVELTVIGSVLLAAGHLRNYRLSAARNA